MIIRRGTLYVLLALAKALSTRPDFFDELEEEGFLSPHATNANAANIAKQTAGRAMPLECLRLL